MVIYFLVFLSFGGSRWMRPVDAETSEAERNRIKNS